MVFQVPPSKRSLKQNQFEFAIGDRQFSVPLLRYIKPSLAFELDGATPAAAAGLLFQEYLPDALPLFEDVEQLNAFATAWQEASGVTSGESEASSDS